MKTNKLFLLIFILCCLTACNNDDDGSISPIKETTIKGDASTLQIEMDRGNWSITSITTFDGVTMVDENNRPLQLEGLGNLHFRWFDLTREKETLLTLTTNDNFDGKERGFIINLAIPKGFYTEQIIIRQEPCSNFYQIESINYSIEEGDGIVEAQAEHWGMVVQDYTNHNGETIKTRFWPFYGAYINYSFSSQSTESIFINLNPNEEQLVKIPRGIENGKIVFEEGTRPFTTFTKCDSELKEVTVEANQVNQKQNTYSADIYYKRLQMTYELLLTRPESETNKVFTGKLIKNYPYGCSEIRHEVSDLPERE